MILSNNENCIRIDSKDRRFTYVKVSSAKRMDRDYFDPLYEVVNHPERNQEFLENLYNYLYYVREIEGVSVDVYTPFATKERTQLGIDCLDPTLKHVYDRATEAVQNSGHRFRLQERDSFGFARVRTFLWMPEAREEGEKSQEFFVPSLSLYQDYEVWKRAANSSKTFGEFPSTQGGYSKQLKKLIAGFRTIIPKDRQRVPEGDGKDRWMNGFLLLSPESVLKEIEDSINTKRGNRQTASEGEPMEIDRPRGGVSDGNF